MVFSFTHSSVQSSSKHTRRDDCATNHQDCDYCNKWCFQRFLPEKRKESKTCDVEVSAKSPFSLLLGEEISPHLFPNLLGGLAMHINPTLYFHTFHGTLGISSYTTVYVHHFHQTQVFHLFQGLIVRDIILWRRNIGQLLRFFLQILQCIFLLTTVLDKAIILPYMHLHTLKLQVESHLSTNFFKIFNGRIRGLLASYSEGIFKNHCRMQL